LLSDFSRIGGDFLRETINVKIIVSGTMHFCEFHGDHRTVITSS